jgi:hypothetical protein
MDIIGNVLGLDRYERSARLYPALLSVAPVSATMFLWAPQASVLVGGAASATVTAALSLLLMRYGRSRGRIVQERLIARNGGLESTTALRHRDRRVATASKERYHRFLRAQGLKIPQAAAEAADPAKADDIYRSAADWLRTRTRDPAKFELLHAENRDFGFRRNLLGLKPLGLSLAMLSFLANARLGYLFMADHMRLLVSAILGAALLATIMAWLVIVTMDFVADAARSYTEQLLACCDILAERAPSTKSSGRSR